MTDFSKRNNDIYLYVEDMMKLFSKAAPKATISEYNRMYEAVYEHIKNARVGPRV